MFNATQLVGFGAFTEAAGSTLSLTFVAEGTNTGTTITIPVAGRVAGYFCIIFNKGTSGNVTPSLFTSANDAGSLNIVGNISYKVLDGTETTVSGIATNGRWVVVVFSPSRPIGSVIYTQSGNAVGSSNPALQNITVAGETTPLLIVAHAGETSVAPSPTASPDDMTALTSGNVSEVARYLLWNPGGTPANHTWDMADAGANLLQSGFFEFT
jgi:hypothetical protein